jgi:hypothetical protein|tara:strand:- start:240 stop:515 length:276 start_codon:yes stop_codon:yes gene_type:complete
MIKNKKKTKRRIFLNGVPKKVDYDVYQVLDEQTQQLRKYELALCTYLEIYELIAKPTDKEKLLHDWCRQFPMITELLDTIKEFKEQENESK